MALFDNIPKELSDVFQRSEDVSVLVGQNGSGKSTLLDELAEHFLKNGKRVVAIANSIHDKFSSRNRKFSALRGRSGRRQTRLTMKKAMQAMAKDEERNRLKTATTALEYVGFDPVIGFKLENFRPENVQLYDIHDIPVHQIDEIERLMDQVQSHYVDDEIIWMETDKIDFYAMEKTNLTQLFLWESKLKKLKIISRIEVYLRKNDRDISMLTASLRRTGLNYVYCLFVHSYR